MKIVFWNIGPGFNNKKKDMILQIINSYKPDVFCVAEGSISIKEAEEIEDTFTDTKVYKCYYSPLFYKNTAFNLTYGWKKNGLKLFYRHNFVPRENFTSFHQRRDGRIVTLDSIINNKKTSLLFLHNFSKSGNREVTDKQKRFIGSLADMINLGKINQDSEQTLIIGDFNLEPWDNIMRDKEYLDTTFIEKQKNLNQRDTNYNTFHNPLLDYISYSNNTNLLGTYYSNTSGWALFDYVLFNTQSTYITQKIITSLKGTSLLNNDQSLKKDFLKEEIDHLPILIQIRK
jgi:exonuclease III